MRADTQKALNNILDTFSGADGGVSFVKFRCLLEDLDLQAHRGEPAAIEIVNVVKRFSRLVDVARDR